ncbi:hypothetical protein KJN74_00435 [Candidatus Bathyarchaeota archaeon]|nr:hypothetical protein [Candidatus Bathyarchaeota archaeon]
MVFTKIRKSWKKRARRHLVKKEGEEDWRIFTKALCGSWNKCNGFPYDCKCCFDNYFKDKEFLHQILEK